MANKTILRRKTNHSNKTTRQTAIFNEDIRSTFNQAIKDIEKVAIRTPESLRQIFYHSFESYKQASLLIRFYQACKEPIIHTLEPGLFGRNECDLFFALSEDAREKLKQQGINYEQNI